MSNTEKITVTVASLEFPMCPTVITGITKGGRIIRARYRFGRLVIRIYPRHSIEDSVEAAAWIYDQQIDSSGLGGCLDYQELREITAGLVDWPDELTPNVIDHDDPDLWMDDFWS